MITMSAVWDRTAAFLRDHLAAVAAIAGPTLYGPGVVQDVLQPVAATTVGGPKLGMSLLSLALSLVAIFGQAALIALAIDPPAGRGGAFSRGLARLPAMIGVSLLLLLAFMLLFIPPVVIAAAGGFDFTALSAQAVPDLAPGSALMIVLYLLILAPVLVWLAARLALVAPVVVGERRWVGAIRRSFVLTRGLAARIVGVFLLFIIVAAIAELAAKAVFGSILRIALGNEGTVNAASVLTALIVALVATAVTVILTTFAVQLYLAVRDRDHALGDRDEVPAPA